MLQASCLAVCQVAGEQVRKNLSVGRLIPEEKKEVLSEFPLFRAYLDGQGWITVLGTSKSSPEKVVQPEGGTQDRNVYDLLPNVAYSQRPRPRAQWELGTKSYLRLV